MSRKKASNQDTLYNHVLTVRLSRQAYENLGKIQKQSNCRSKGELARKILSQERFKFLYRDVSLNAPMEEMALIRKELKAIGVNINQQTHHFHTSESASERAFYVIKTAALYQQIDGKVEQLLSLISKLAEKWLPKSKAEKV